ncbi:hypothetical protein D3C76_27780 [compost metagenome]
MSEELFNLRTNPIADQHRNEPVALPDRDAMRIAFTACKYHAPHIFEAGWNACLNEIAKLGSLYTHADPDEVERLSAENEAMLNAEEDLLARRDFWARKFKEAEKECDTLRAQLAERNALLRDRFGDIRKLAERACGRPKDSPEYRSIIEAINPTMLLDLTALSASAEQKQKDPN